MKDAAGQLLGATTNDFYYCLYGGSSPVTGSSGPIAASSISGSYTLNINTASAQGATLIGLEVADASTTTSLAVGAALIALGQTQSVTVGPMNKSGYEVNALPQNQYYSFQLNVVSLTNGGSADVTCGLITGVTGFDLGSVGSASSIAYMGNGIMADYLTLPAASRFSTSTSASKSIALTGNSALYNNYPVALNDVYCVKLSTGGYAWLQITSTGFYPYTGPSFNFRLNTILNYCAYQQSTADLNSVVVFNLANATPSYGLAISGPSNAAATAVYANVMNNSNAWIQSFNLSPTPSPVATMAVTYAYTSGGLAVAGGGTTIIKSYPSQGIVEGYQVGSAALPVMIGAYDSGLSNLYSSTSAYVSNGDWVDPYGVAADSNNTVYGTDVVGSAACTYQIMDFSSSSYTGAPITVATFSGLSCTPYDLAVTVSSGVTDIYVADTGNDQVALYRSTNVFAAAAATWANDNASPPHTFVSPAGIALNGQGRLVVANLSTSFSVVEWNISNPTSPSYLGEWGPTLPNYGAVSINSSDTIGLKIDNASPPNIYLLDYGNDKVVSFKGL